MKLSLFMFIQVSKRAVVPAFVLTFLGSMNTQADPLTLDSSGTNPNAPVSGSASWDTSAANTIWSDVLTAPGSATDAAWNNTANNIAVFDNGINPATVTIDDGPVTVSGLVFNNTSGVSTTGYTITDGGNSGDTLTLSGATPTITTYANATIEAGLASTTGLTKNGTGSLTLSSFGNFQYSGTTTINGGVLNITSSSSLGTGSVVLNGAGSLEASGQSLSLASAVGKTFTAAGGTLILNNAPTVSIGSIVRSAGGGLIIVPTNSTALGTVERVGTLTPLTTVNGIVDASFIAANSATDSSGDFLTYSSQNGFVRATYSGATAITNGVSGGTTSTSIFHATTATNNNVTAPTQLYALKVDSGASVNGATLTLGDGSHTAGLIIDNDSPSLPTRINTAVTFATGSEGAIYVGGNPTIPDPMNPPPQAFILGTVSGTNGLTKSGNGALELANAQYAGVTTINQGTLQFDQPSTSGVSAGSVINLAGTVWYNNSSGTGVEATVNLTSDGAIGAGKTGGPVKFAGVVNGNGHVLSIASATANGLVSWQGLENNVSQIDVSEGILQANGSIQNSGSLPEIQVIDRTNSGQSSLSIASGSIVNNAVTLNGGFLTGGNYSNEVSTLTGSLSVQTAGFVVTTAGDFNLAGSIQGAVPIYFKNTGSGTDIISGTANTYTGTTEVILGKVEVTGDITSSNQVNVGSAPGSTATLLGTGLVSQINLTANGKLSPGLSGVGTLTATGMTWNSDGTGQLQYNLGANAAASTELSLGTGAFTKGTGSSFVFDFLDSGVAGQDYTLVTFGAGDTNFSLADFQASDLAADLGGTFSLVNNGAAESLDFAVAEVPEPGTTALLASGILGLLLVARSRRGESGVRQE